jgi:hypothetical protein
LRFVLSKTYFKIAKYSEKIPVIDPSGKFKVTWDFFVLLNIIFFAFFIPICTVFKGDINQQEIFMYDQFYLIKSVFILDFVFNINTSIYDKGRIIEKRMLIIKTYFKKDFLTEVVSLVGLFTFSVHDDNKYSITFSDFPSIIFLMKLNQFSKIVQKLEERYK